MARPRRVYLPGVSLHLIRRGNNRCAIVRDEPDHRVLLRTIRRAAARNDVSVHAYVVMTTHYHLIVTPLAATALQRMMKSVGERYVNYFNRKYDRVGTLWAGRYRDIPLDDERRLLTCLRYVEQNPVRAKMVSTPDAYEWSSYRVHAHGVPSDWLVAHHVYVALGATRLERQRAYRAICGVPLTAEELVLQRHPEPRDREAPHDQLPHEE